MLNYALVATAFGVFAAYVIALPYLGFRVATLAFLLAMPAALERPRTRRRWIAILAVALIGTALTFFAFESYLKVLLPRGRWTGW
jgi:Mn2+/Fe2+ NRAMP family transporter